MADPAMSVKLLINKQTKQVLFAEAGKEFVDFLFLILSLPMATVINLVGKRGMVGSVANLYESVENLDENYMRRNKLKNTILKPASLVTDSDSFVSLVAIQDKPPQMDFYRCNCSYSTALSAGPNTVCTNCHSTMRCKMSYVPPPEEQQITGKGGYVKGVVTYMVMDDLMVKPMSTISSITLLNKFKIGDVGTLEEKVVDFGMDKALKLLKASMDTKNVLTSVFLNPTNA